MWNVAGFLKPIEKRPLGGEDFLARKRQREPYDAVDFWKGLNTSAARWPFEFELIAAQSAGIKPTLDRESLHKFPTPLPDLAKWLKHACRLRAHFLGKLAQSCAFGILARADF